MNQKTAIPVDSPTLDSAFEALKSYNTGSPRGALCPLDHAVISILADPKARNAMESRFVSVLKSKPSSTAVGYICSKLVLIGSEACVPALAQYLGDATSSTDARNALEKIPGPAASKALRQALPKLSLPQRLGAIQSLGARRDTASISILAQCLKEPAEVATAAAALGQIGSVKAARALREYLEAGPKSFPAVAADAALVCAERLLAEGHDSEARSLYQALLAANPPVPVQQAAARGLTNCAAVRSHRPGT